MDISLSQIRGIGPARVKAFEAAGIRTVRELVMFLPREYRDLSNTVPLAMLKPGEVAAVRVRVAGEVSERRAKRLLITKLYVTDGTDSVQVVWYNQPWLKKQMTPGRELLLYGKAELKNGYVTLIINTARKPDQTQWGTRIKSISPPPIISAMPTILCSFDGCLRGP